MRYLSFAGRRLCARKRVCDFIVWNWFINYFLPAFFRVSCEEIFTTEAQRRKCMKTGNLLPPRRQACPERSRRERQVRKLSFRPSDKLRVNSREKSFLVPSDSLGMTDLSPSLCGLCAPSARSGHALREIFRFSVAASPCGRPTTPQPRTCRSQNWARGCLVANHRQSQAGD